MQKNHQNSNGQYRAFVTEYYKKNYCNCRRKVDRSANNRLLSLLCDISHKCHKQKFPISAGICIADSCCFCKFLFDGKLQKYDISVKRKHSKSNETMIPSGFFHQFFVTQKLDFSRNGKFNEVFSARKYCVHW